MRIVPIVIQEPDIFSSAPSPLPVGRAKGTVPNAAVPQPAPNAPTQPTTPPLRRAAFFIQL